MCGNSIIYCFFHSYCCKVKRDLGGFRLGQWLARVRRRLLRTHRRVANLIVEIAHEGELGSDVIHRLIGDLMEFRHLRGLVAYQFERHAISLEFVDHRHNLLEKIGVIQIGIVPKPEAEMIKTISMNLDSALPKVRYCAARAAGITQWQAFVPDLEMMLKMETDPDAREAAEHALAVCMRNSR